MKKNILKRLGILSSFCLWGMSLVAQGFSPAAMELLKQQKLWFHSRNASGAVFDDTRNYSNVQMSYRLESGNFHRPQEGQQYKSLNVSSEGFLNLKNAYVWGKFAFEQANTYDAGYNASIADPFRGMPYYVADSYLSNWRNQHYNLKFRASTPLYRNKFALGLEGRYVATIAAKQRDPRVDTRYYKLELVPGITYVIYPEHRLGVNFEYASIKEDSRMGQADVYTDQDYYELYGLGVAVKGIGSGRTTNYYGDQIGAGLQYNYSSRKVNLLFEGNYAMKVENVDISFENPKKDASVREQIVKTALSLHKMGNRFSHFIKVRYFYSQVDGIQYISLRDNSESQRGWIDLYHNIRSTYQRQTASVSYSFIKNKGNEYAWKVDADILYKKHADEYLLPGSTKESENLFFGLSGKLNLSIGDKLNRRLLISAKTGYNKNLSGHYQYGGVHTDYLTVTMLEVDDENYLTSDYYKAGLAATYSQQYSEDKRSNFFAKLSFDYVKTSDYDFKHRNHALLSVGVIF